MARIATIWGSYMDGRCSIHFRGVQITNQLRHPYGQGGIPWFTTDLGGFHNGNIDGPTFRELLCNSLASRPSCVITVTVASITPTNVPRPLSLQPEASGDYSKEQAMNRGAMKSLSKTSMPSSSRSENAFALICVSYLLKPMRMGNRSSEECSTNSP